MAPDPKGDAARAGQIARFLRSEIEEGHRFLAKFGPAEGVEERDRAIREWNETYSRNVEADVTETMMLGIPRREGEDDAHYLARLKRTAERWRTQRASAIFPATPANAAPPPQGPPASQPTARKGGRKTG